MNEIELTRKTNETDIALKLKLFGEGKNEIESSEKFFSHMLDLLAKNALIDLKLKAFGDLEHHTIEDAGIVLGQALGKALGNKEARKRYGFFLLPMDESLALASIDLSGRGKLVFDASFNRESVEGFSTELVKEFFEAVALNAGMTVQLKLLNGENAHHKIEALFKCFGRALRMAIEEDPRVKGIPSTKGLL